MESLKKNRVVKIQGSNHVVCLLLSSMLLNGFFMMNLFYNENNKLKLTWSVEAASEAEEVAALACSGHGRAYLDGLIVDDDNMPVCECNTCFEGPDCSVFSSDCPANADSGDPIFLEPFWKQNAANSAIVTAGWHRMSYKYDDNSYISQELKKRIFEVHRTVQNAVTTNKFIIFGAGSTQLINAAVYALSPITSPTQTKVLASSPYYPLYSKQTDFFNSTNYKFQGDTSLWKNNDTDYNDASLNLIEIVTSPNNPDGQLKKAMLHGKSVKELYDHAYYWPHFTAIPSASDKDLMIFTISKLTGHAGSRFGWALIKDESVYTRMLDYMTLNTMGVSRDTQLRALKVLKVVLEGQGNEIFKFAYKTMSDRWIRLREALSRSTSFSIQELAPEYCTFFKRIREPSPAYAWLKCEREEDTNCSEVLKAASIIGRDGKIFSADNRYVRLSLIKSQDDFDSLIHKINMLVSKEYSSQTTESI